MIMDMNINKVRYESYFGNQFTKNDLLPEVRDEYDLVLQECSKLYSEHYGKWSNADNILERRGKPIKLSPNRLKKWLGNDTIVYLARNDNHLLIGYAIALRTKVKCYDNKVVSWVMQLVVHKDYRNKSIAKTLLKKIWQFSNDYAWGIISANPYAIRALESATHRRCDSLRIKKNIKKILSLGCEHLPYIDETTETILDENESKINTRFFVDHSDVPAMRENVTKQKSWLLGDIEEGWEWLAFTFHDQPLTKMSESEWEQILRSSDNSVKDAYRRMDLSSESQTWMKYTDKEADFIMKECRLQKNDEILDLGCGTGRHAFGLAEKGIHVFAVDYLEKHFYDYQNSLSNKSKYDFNHVKFICDDVRTLASLSNKKFKAVICLYDVIGSYADNEENKKILRQISERLEPGGYAVISVMNYETINQADHFSADELLSLTPSNTMETTGNVFDSKHLLVNSTTQVVYRKEQFERGNLPPVELIVRDRRFRKNEIEQMCREVGLEVEFSRYARAGNWNDMPLINDQKNAKEILVKCRK
ncbi:MAG: GNAT family N-acetyltransferase [Planctomycetaceae bacterium]|jgi:2-polyprenyl-3-methyl-5-hydroxy-6-metoxy-1,4-benzoquinol methylase/GNAT superfamily N-acetyltransferase|nr:GNAT family N-acetyltransferase [Planctomycetaceae bacterium]